MNNELPDRIATLMAQARIDLSELVAYRSVADADVEPAEQCEGAAAWVCEALAAAGAQNVVANPTPDGSKAVTADFVGPEGAPTVLLYSHFDVQPAGDPAKWQSPPFELTERDGRWYGRGTADCKGNTIAILTALRALGSEQGGALPVNVKVVVEGSEEQGTGGLEQFAAANPELLASDAIVICDSGNFELGLPTITTTLRGMADAVVEVETMQGPLHSGVFGGAAPDALAVLIKLLATLTDERGNTTIAGLDAEQRWRGVEYTPEKFRFDAGVLAGVELAGSGSVAEMIWARPAVTVLGIDAPDVDGSINAVSSAARARVSVRVPPGMSACSAQDALRKQLETSAPLGARVSVQDGVVADPFTGATTGEAFGALGTALEAAYGKPMVTAGQGGSIPLCNTLAELYPEAAIMLLGVEEPLCQIHAPNESVDPSEIERIALALALFLGRYGN